jgi:Flp pilus assembly protein TadG
MRLGRDERGQVLVVTALCISALIAFVGLATDVGLLFRARRNVQIAADAAATAGALDYMYNVSTTSAKSAAQTASTANGITNGTGGAVVTVNMPPLGGYHKTTGYVEVVISQPNPTFFMKLFSFNTVSVAARAVAGTPGIANNCAFILDTSASPSMDLQGAATFSGPNCGVVVDSNANNALDATGNASTLVADSVAVVGTVGSKVNSTPAPVTGVVPENDPLRVQPPVVPAACASTNASASVSNTTVTPSGILCFTNANGVTLNNVTLNTGTYVFENGVTLSGVTSGPGGTTLDINGGSMSITSNSTLTLVAPTSGTYNGVAIMQPASNTSEIDIQKGSSNANITGIIYAPTAELYLNDNGGSVSLTTDLIVGTLFIKASTLSISSYSAANPTTTPLRAVSLVE